MVRRIIKIIITICLLYKLLSIKLVEISEDRYSFKAEGKDWQLYIKMYYLFLKTKIFRFTININGNVIFDINCFI